MRVRTQMSTSASTSLNRERINTLGCNARHSVGLVNSATVPVKVCNCAVISNVYSRDSVGASSTSTCQININRKTSRRGSGTRSSANAQLLVGNANLVSGETFAYTTKCQKHMCVFLNRVSCIFKTDFQCMSRCFGHGSPLSVRPQVPHDYVTRVDVNLEVELLADQYNTQESQWVRHPVRRLRRKIMTVLENL